MDPAYNQPLALDVSNKGIHLEIGKIIATEDGPWGTSHSAFRIRNGYEYWLNGNGFLKGINIPGYTSASRLNTLGYFKFNAYTGQQPIWSFETQGGATQRDCVAFDEGQSTIRLYPIDKNIPKSAGSDDILDGQWHPIKIRHKSIADGLGNNWQVATHDTAFDGTLNCAQVTNPGTPFNLGYEDFTKRGSDLSMSCVAIYRSQELSAQLTYDHGKFAYFSCNENLTILNI